MMGVALQPPSLEMISKSIQGSSVFVKAIIRVLSQRVAAEIKEPYEPRRVVVGAEPRA
jgi:hypothetical protein